MIIRSNYASVITSSPTIISGSLREVSSALKWLLVQIGNTHLDGQISEYRTNGHRIHEPAYDKRLSSATPLKGDLSSTDRDSPSKCALWRHSRNPRPVGLKSLSPLKFSLTVPNFRSEGFSTSRVASAEAVLELEVVRKRTSWTGRGWNRAPTSEVVGIDENKLDELFESIPDLQEKLKFLETCGLGDNQLTQMRKRLPNAVKNTFLKLSLKKLIRVATFLDEEVGVDKKDFGNLLFSNPYIAGSSVDECLRPKVDFLRQRGITKEEMGKMVLRSPQILTYSLEGKLLAIEQKLLEIGLKGDEIGRVFVRYPALIGTSLAKFDKNIETLKEAGISQIPRAISKIPQIMSLSLDSKYKGIISFLQEDLRLQPEQILRIISSQISILSFSVDTNIRPKVGYFIEMGLCHDEIARIIVRYPNVFCHSLEKSIKPKVNYLVKQMQIQIHELTTFPHFLSYSLSDRIVPRHDYVKKHGFSFKLSSLLTCSDKVFQKRYGLPMEAGLKDESLAGVLTSE